MSGMPLQTDETVCSAKRINQATQEIAKAVELLGSKDLLTKDSEPVIGEALERLDDLHDRLGNYHSRLFPRDARERLEMIRFGLRLAGAGGDPREAFRELQALAEELGGVK